MDKGLYGEVVKVNVVEGEEVEKVVDGGGVGWGVNAMEGEEMGVGKLDGEVVKVNAIEGEGVLDGCGLEGEMVKASAVEGEGTNNELAPSSGDVPNRFADLKNPWRWFLRVSEQAGGCGAWLVLDGEGVMEAKATEEQRMGARLWSYSQSISTPRKPPEIDSRGHQTRWAVWGVVGAWWGEGKEFIPTKSQQESAKLRQYSQSISTPRKPQEVDSRGPQTRWVVWDVTPGVPERCGCSGLWHGYPNKKRLREMPPDRGK
ncbi:hypothetical protein BDN72DRAFT_917656 [Pluteus cervinus]|uniref:Uncharacterized protein n=1 Tax=Pluteus cervinus TaxID=181527 RepID=A0ACD2ZXB4_9AGAR|nr:hypothetical protein BDN72DRAFT_917656 [Pluteus cervinus]